VIHLDADLGRGCEIDRNVANAIVCASSTVSRRSHTRSTRITSWALSTWRSSGSAFPRGLHDLAQVAVGAAAHDRARACEVAAIVVNPPRGDRRVAVRPSRAACDVSTVAGEVDPARRRNRSRDPIDHDGAVDPVQSIP